MQVCTYVSHHAHASFKSWEQSCVAGTMSNVFCIITCMHVWGSARHVVYMAQSCKPLGYINMLDCCVCWCRCVSWVVVHDTYIVREHIIYVLATFFGYVYMLWPNITCDLESTFRKQAYHIIVIMWANTQTIIKTYEYVCSHFCSSYLW